MDASTSFSCSRFYGGFSGRQQTVTTLRSLEARKARTIKITAHNRKSYSLRRRAVLRPCKASPNQKGVPPSLEDFTATSIDGFEGTLTPDYVNDQGFLPRRWRVAGGMSLAFVLCNMDKVNMSIALIPMANEFGWSATEKGLVASTFFWGYTLTQTTLSDMCRLLFQTFVTDQKAINAHKC
eukprot:9503255-Pyramimonas_sp.AAC.1